MVWLVGDRLCCVECRDGHFKRLVGCLNFHFGGCECKKYDSNDIE